MLALLLGAGSAQAAFPGANGRIAFDTLRYDFSPRVVTIAPDGSGFTNISGLGNVDSFPAWSPNGSRIAFSADFTATDGGIETMTMDPDGNARTAVTATPGLEEYKTDWSPDGTRLAVSVTSGGGPRIYTMNADGTLLTFLAEGVDPAWSPDGTQIAFSRHDGLDYEIYRVDTNGNDELPLTDNDTADLSPDWSPDGSRIAYVATEDGNAEIYAINSADGFGGVNLTNDLATDLAPAWSPDGTKLAFSSDRAAGESAAIYTMNTDGTNPTRITFPQPGDLNEGEDLNPDWQPLNALRPYPRPGGGSPLLVPLVPAYARCAPETANSMHAAPVMVPSCEPAVLSSPLLTTSTSGRGTGSVRFDAQPGDVATAADEADFLIKVSIGDVRQTADGLDYPGSLLFRTRLRITDNASGFGGVSATVRDTDLSLPIPCVTNELPAGSTCAVNTTADTLVPGLVVERRRTIAAASTIELLDAGADGDVGQTAPGCPIQCGTGDETVYAEPGIFAP
jgi:hypothetical protein